MKQIVVISGKGGTGKTTICASFAALAKNKVMADCDVDAADLYLILKPQIKQKEEFWGSKVAYIDKDICDQGRSCENICRYEAIDTENFTIDEVSCEGCGVCVHFCHREAITLKENLSGHWFVSDTKYGPFVHAKLGIAEENSGKLVTLVRQKAKSIAEEQNLNYIIIDGPPGIGCPVIASLSGVDLALVVTEPTQSGIYDLQRIIGVAKHFNVKSLVCINKYDLNEDVSKEIEDYCHKNKIGLLGKIPYNQTVTKALVLEKSVIEYSDNGVSQEIRRIWEEIDKDESRI